MVFAPQQQRRIAPFGRFNGRIGRRLLLWFLAFSLVPLLLSNTVGYVKSEAIIERLVYRYMNALAEVQARHVNDQVHRHLVSLELVATGNRFLAAGATVMSGGDAGLMGQAANRTAVAEYLTRKLEELRAFDGLYLQQVSGAVLAGVSSGVTEARLSPLEPGSGLHFAVLDSAAVGPLRYRMSAPVYDGQGRTVAFLTGTISSGTLGTLLEIPEHLAGSIESYVVDLKRRPVFVSHPRGPIDYTRPLRSAAAAGAGTHNSRYRDEQGIEVLATVVPVPGLPWLYVTEVPVSDALGPLRSLRVASLWFEAMLSVVILLAAWLVATGIVAPVRRLVEAARQVGRGDLNVQVETRGSDEVAELGETFNEMTHELSSASANLRELHQREIQRAQQLATVGELASGVAHEIKNPLVGVSNGVDLVRRRIGHDAELSPILEEMARQLTRMDSAIRDLLAFARPATPALAPVDANQIARRALRLVEPAAQHLGVSIAYRPDPDCGELLADHELIEQALVNLLMNAVQATAPSGHVVVSTQLQDGHVLFRVADNGRGIIPGDLEHIFKPFYTTKHSGTGLGLSITRDIVERHGGRIEVDTQVGKGSTFTVILPAMGVRPDPAPLEVTA